MKGIDKRSKTMRFSATICLFFIGLVTGFGQLIDNFSDGDFTTNPVWSGETIKYEVNLGNQLHLNAPVISDTAYLSTNIGTLDFSATTVWEFYAEATFNPSNSNNFRVYLTSDNSNFRASLNGYYIRIGENGSADRLKFYKQVGTTSTLLFTGTTSTFGTSPTARVRVTRDGTGSWLFEADSSGGTTYLNEGTVANTDISPGQFFGVYSKFTSSNSTNIFYDDFTITGTIFVDVTPPTVSSVAVISATELDVLFDEPVDQVIAETLGNYSASSGIGIPATALLDGTNPALIHLTFGTLFTNGQTDTLTIQNVNDLSGNTMVTETQTFMYFVPALPNYRDVVINEIFADPSPQIGLPAAEFIELYNASSSIFDLNGWMFSDPSSTATLGTYILQPGEYVIIADDNFTFDFSIYPNVLFVGTLPSLNNASDDISLQSSGGVIIDQLSYSSAWYQDPVKDNGGYTLEQINPVLPCLNSSNWIASNHPYGGTPGLVNSVYNAGPDVSVPSVISSDVLSSTNVNLCFNETLDTSNIAVSQFAVSGGVTVSSVTIDASLSCLSLILTPALDTGIVYILTLNGMGDCSGNLVSNASVEVILPHTAYVGDIIINEVLFNPFTGGSDFVEVYNNSEKYIDLFSWKLANWNDGSPSSYKTVNKHYLMSPKEYTVLTKDSNDIQNNYLNSVFGTFLQMDGLPSYSNDSGTVYLILPDVDSTISDYFIYSADLQFGLINNPDGISLERIDFNRATNEATNWHSAAESAGWATPGFENSQYYPGQVTGDMVNVQPEIFSPDNDGFEDVLNINYQMEGSGYVGNITIYDAKGRIIRSLMQNELLAVTGTVTWDGLNNKREKARIGMYIIYFEIFDLNGNVNGVKKTCVLASKLN